MPTYSQYDLGFAEGYNSRVNGAKLSRYYYGHAASPGIHVETLNGSRLVTGRSELEYAKGFVEGYMRASDDEHE